MRALTLNAGSSSLKAAVYELEQPGNDGDPPPAPRWAAELEMVDGAVVELLSSLCAGSDPVISRERPIDAVGHRIVHGGADLVQAARLTTRVHEAIARVAECAPMHNIPALAVVDAATRAFGETVPQVAVFDTAFHTTLAPAAYSYAGPFEWVRQGIRKYGFHGISHRYASHRAARMLNQTESPRRVVTCHLGSGCSLAAVQDGRSVDTTMGFTPLDGVPMATRSGAVDPGILIHLLRRGEHTADSLERLLNHDAGLAGLSGTSGDMRAVLSALDGGSERAQLAFDVYVRHLRQAVSSMATSMNGLDALVFTGGVGEHAPRVRAAVCEGLAFLGVTLDQPRNEACVGDAILSDEHARVAVLVIRAQENWIIAQECLRVATDAFDLPCTHGQTVE
ncbi:MAG: acetate/propionate family kinase [Gemmatimonadota bacterium]|nr:acetate/propionate family kinase [Gemmatimonadota bacterium]